MPLQFQCMARELEVARYILRRHKDEIEQEEVRSLSRLRQTISPYSDYVSKLKSKVLEDLAPYRKEEKFLDAVEHILSHLSEIEAVDLPVQYSLSFEEIEQMKAASRIDKALLATSLLRAVGSEDAACVSGNKYAAVKFAHMGENYALDVENNSLLKGAEADAFIQASEPKYIFNDLFFEFGK